MKRMIQIKKSIKLCKYKHIVGYDVSKDGIGIAHILLCNGFIKVLSVGVKKC